MWRGFSIITCILIFGSALTVTLPVNTTAGGSIIYVDDDNTSGIEYGSLQYPYNTIQEGIEAAVSGDTVYVFSGNYLGPIAIMKSNLTLLGEDRDTTIIEGGNWSEAIYITGHGVRFENFTVQYSGFPHSGMAFVGIVIRASNCEIIHNNVRDNDFGIVLCWGSDNIIADNEVSNNKDGILLVPVYSNLTICSNKIVANNISNNRRGIVLNACSYNNTIIDNDISMSDKYGILIRGGTNNLLVNNSVRYNNEGIGIYGGENNTVNYNIITNNVRGICLNSSSHNLIYHNKIIDNSDQVFDTQPAINDWHHPTLLEGNFWFDYTGLDDGSGTGKHAIAGDGIGDTLIPHPSSDFDYYPLMNENGGEEPVKLPPVADAGPDQTVNEGDVVNFHGSGKIGGGGGGWAIQTVDSNGTVGTVTSMTLDSNDNPHISYLDFTNDHLKYAKWTGSTWSIETVDPYSRVIHYNSMALNSSDNPHISYFDAIDGDLKYATWTGGTWFIETVDSSGSVGWYTSIAFDSSDNPHISYYDSTNSDLKYARRNGTVWNIETVDSNGTVGWYTSIALDNKDSPHISYTGNFNLKYAKWANNAWNIETVDPAHPVGGYTSLALDSNKNPHISYYDFTGDLKYAKWTGSVWNIDTIDSDDAVGGYTSIALDSSDNPHISYYDWTNVTLKYAKWANNVWNIETVDSTDAVGGFTSMALDRSDNPHISYYDSTNSDLKYAKRTGDGGKIISYEWDFDANVDSNGDGNSTNDIDATGPKPTYVYGDDGVYTVILTVTDNQGLSDIDTMLVTVENVAPAIAPFGPLVSDEGAPINLTAISTDPGSDDLIFIWEFELGPTITNTYYNDGLGTDPYPSPWGTYPFQATDTVEHAYGDNGDYTVTLTVEDDDGGSTTYTINITVNNVAPTIENMEAYVYVNFTLRVAGEKWHNVDMYIYEDGEEIGYGEVTRYPGSPDDQSVTIANVKCDVTKTITMTVLYTPDDDPVNGQPTGANPCWVNITFEDGSYELLHNTFKVNHPETWVWNIEFNQYLVGHEITFVATAIDPGSDDLTFTWNWGDGTPDTETAYYNEGAGSDPWPSPWGTFPFNRTDVKKHIYVAAGNYIVTLTVTDDDGGVDYDFTTATIDNVVPIAHAGGPYFGNEGEGITYTGTQTAPSTSGSFIYYWDFGDGSSSTQQNPIHIYANYGIYTVRLTITSEYGEIDTDICDVYVNANPIANAGSDQTVYEGEVVQFDGGGSYDLDGTIISYEWDFDANVDMDGDGNHINDADVVGPSVQHAYDIEGEYQVTLTVTDGFSIGITAITITVLPNAPPVEDEEPDKEEYFDVNIGELENKQDETLNEDNEKDLEPIVIEDLGSQNPLADNDLIGNDEKSDNSVDPDVYSSEEPNDEDGPDFPLYTITVSVCSIIISSLSLSLPLYMKINRKDLLKNRKRKLIYKYISTNPGDNFNGIKQALNLTNGVLTYHLKILEREDFITSKRASGYKRYYLTGQTNNIIVLNGFQKNIVDIIMAQPGISQTEIAEKIGTTVQVVNYHIKKLLDEGVVKIQMANGHRSQCFINNQ